MKVMDELLEQVNSFVYLGTVISACDDCKEDVNSRLGRARGVIV